MANDLWPMFEPVITPHLGREDDLGLWAAVVNAVYTDANALCRSVASRRRLLTRLGRCSHWLRPHQARWTADGGFAWPSGYDGRGFSCTGLPEFDWFVQFAWCPEPGSWALSSGDLAADQLLLRVAVPARSRRHRQAAVHTLWQPGSPVRPRKSLMQLYGFREKSGWLCTAYSGPADVYELAAEGQDAEPVAAPDPAAG